MQNFFPDFSLKKFYALLNSNTKSIVYYFLCGKSESYGIEIQV